MSSYDLIAFDMDGTLLNSKKEISPLTLECVNNALDKGKIVVLSTGRGVAEIKDYLPLMPKLRYVISMSGALLYDVLESKVIFDNPISDREARIVLKEASKRDVMIQLLTTEESVVENSKRLRMKDYKMSQYQVLYDSVATSVDDVVDYYLERMPTVYKINSYHRSFEESTLLMNELSEKVLNGELDLELVYSEETSLESSNKGSTKGKGLIKLCEYLGIDIERTIAVGDADNDLDILGKAGLAIAMGNAKEKVLAISDVVVADCDHDGCVEAIQKFLF